VEDKDRYIYRSIVIDCLLAIKVLSKLGKTDPDRFGCPGNEPGVLAIITTALDERVKAAACDLPG
jgi:cephalosporin-C deacetylase-like acetyl esterase